jgi:undecaprenyl-diphosphatase
VFYSNRYSSIDSANEAKDPMNIFDSTIVHGFNHYSRFSWTFDSTVSYLVNCDLLKGGVLVILFWWGWFKVNANLAHIRIHLISTLIGSLAAIILARLLSLLLPFRYRPLHENGLDFLLPYGMRPTALEGWSSFPSDHAVLFFALSAGLFYVSKRVGAFALIYTIVVIMLPRIYLGLHYPTDVIAGAIIGIMITLLFNSKLFTENISFRAYNFSIKKPEIFYPIIIFITSQIAVLFGDIRSLIEFIYRMSHTIIHHIT